MNDRYAVILVYTTAHAIHLEKQLKGRGVGCKLIPVPRHLSSDCGVCVRISAADIAAAEEVISSTGLEVGGIRTL